MVGGKRPAKGPAEGGTGGAHSQVEPTTTRAVATSGTVEVKTRAPVNPAGQAESRKGELKIRLGTSLPCCL
jgi:hypothetical protein